MIRNTRSRRPSSFLFIFSFFTTNSSPSLLLSHTSPAQEQPDSNRPPHHHRLDRGSTSHSAPSLLGLSSQLVVTDADMVLLGGFRDPPLYPLPSLPSLPLSNRTAAYSQALLSVVDTTWKSRPVPLEDPAPLCWALAKAKTFSPARRVSKEADTLLHMSPSPTEPGRPGRFRKDCIRGVIDPSLLGPGSLITQQKARKRG